MEKKSLLEMRGISKRFPGVIANENVDLTLYPGEVHALLGENGAGKSTLMNILTGIYFPNDGYIRYKGRIVSLDSPRKAANLGIGMVHQHFKLVEPMTVAENICLYAHRCGFMLNKKRMNAEVEEYARRFRLSVAPDAVVQQLSIGEQQRVEILKLLVSGAELLILDEPTAVLTPQESDALFAALRKMAAEGKSVLIITHKLAEVMRAADRITVLRGGKSIATMPLAETTQEELTSLMVGHELEKVQRALDSAPGEKVVLSMEKVSVKNTMGLPALSDVDLQIHEGEILGIAGVSGNGQKELAEVLAGMCRPASGKITLDGVDVSSQSPRQAIDRGIAYIPEDRLGVGLVGKMDLSENFILKNFAKPQSSRRGILRQRAVDRQTQAAIEEYNIKSAGIHTPAHGHIPPAGPNVRRQPPEAAHRPRGGRGPQTHHRRLPGTRSGHRRHQQHPQHTAGGAEEGQGHIAHLRGPGRAFRHLRPYRRALQRPSLCPGGRCGGYCGCNRPSYDRSGRRRST